MNASSFVPDDLWEAIEPLLPAASSKSRGGRPRVPDRAALGGIIFVLTTGCPWRLLPQELGYGSGTTCWQPPARHRPTVSAGHTDPFDAPGGRHGHQADRRSRGAPS